MSPLEIKVMIDLHTLADPNMDIPKHLVPIDRFLKKLHTMGIIKYVEGTILEVNSLAIAVYVESLKTIHLPTQKWVCSQEQHGYLVQLQ